MFLKPNNNKLIITDPMTMLPIPRAGKRVSGNEQYWQRRIDCGDVVEVTGPPIEEEVKSSHDGDSDPGAPETSEKSGKEGEK